MDIRYLTDEKGNRVAILIPVEQWEIIRAELGLYDGETETAEILSDLDLLKSIRRGREQARLRVGRRIEEIDVS